MRLHSVVLPQIEMRMQTLSMMLHYAVLPQIEMKMHTVSMKLHNAVLLQIVIINAQSKQTQVTIEGS